MTTVSDDLIRKIKALNAKATKTNNEHEAATFAAKVQELLEKYNLSADVLQEQKQERFGGVKGERTKQKGWAASPFRRMLVSAVCDLYYCKALYYRQSGEFMIIGKPVNVIVAKQMIEYLLESVLRSSREYKGTSNKDTLDFRRGMMTRLCQRLADLRAEKVREEERRRGNNPGNLPALYDDHQSLIASFLDAMGVKSKVGRAVKVNYSTAFAAGDAKGKTVQFNAQIGSK